MFHQPSKKVILEITKGVINLYALSDTHPMGKISIESVQFKTGKSLHTLRQDGLRYAKKFNISFEDRT